MPKRYKPRLKFKRKKEIAIRTLIVLISLSAIVSAPYLYIRYKYLFKSMYVSIKKTNISFIKVEIEDSEIRNDVTNMLKNRIGSLYTQDVRDTLLNDINKKFPYLSQLNISFSSITGTLSIRAKREGVIAVVKSGEEFKYALESGRIINSVSISTSDYITINCEDDCRYIDEESVSFIKELKKNISEFKYNISALKYNFKDKAIKLILDNDIMVIWGNFDFTYEKILKLNEVIKDAISKLHTPLKVDLRFFQEGKILVSENKI